MSKVTPTESDYRKIEKVGVYSVHVLPSYLEKEWTFTMMKVDEQGSGKNKLGEKETLRLLERIREKGKWSLS